MWVPTIRLQIQEVHIADMIKTERSQRAYRHRQDLASAPSRSDLRLQQITTTSQGHTLQVTVDGSTVMMFRSLCRRRTVGVARRRIPDSSRQSPDVDTSHSDHTHYQPDQVRYSVNCQRKLLGCRLILNNHPLILKSLL